MEHEHFWRGRSTGSRLCFFCCCKLPSFFIVTQSLTYTNEAAKTAKKYIHERRLGTCWRSWLFFCGNSPFFILFIVAKCRTRWATAVTHESMAVRVKVMKSSDKCWHSYQQCSGGWKEEMSRYFTSSPFREPLRVCDMYFISTDVLFRLVFFCANSFNPSWVCYCHYLANSSTKSCFFSSSAWIEGWSDFPFVCLQHSGKLSDGPENILFCEWRKVETVKWQDSQRQDRWSP